MGRTSLSSLVDAGSSLFWFVVRLVRRSVRHGSAFWRHGTVGKKFGRYRAQNLFNSVLVRSFLRFGRPGRPKPRENLVRENLVCENLVRTFAEASLKKNALSTPCSIY